MAGCNGVVINKGVEVPLLGKPSNSFIIQKLKQSKRRVGNLVLFNLLMCPFLCGIILLSLWGDSKHEKLEFPKDMLTLVQDINDFLILSFLALWLLYHAVEVLLILAVATDNLRFCRTYLTTVGPLIWTLTILTFNMVMWSGLRPLEDNCITKFLIISGSTSILVANFFTYHLKVLSEHVNYLSIYQMLYERNERVEYV